MACYVFGTNGITDIETDITDEPVRTDLDYDVDEMLDSLSLDELHELRDELTGGNQDAVDVSSIEPIDVAPSPDYSFHWDGGPTHDTDLDEDTQPEPFTKKLTR